MRTVGEIELTELAAAYERDGYGYVRELFTADDLAPLLNALDQGGASPGGFTVPDSQGGRQELSVWMTLHDDFIGVLPRIEPMTGLAKRVLDEDVGHWHSKLSWKRPHAKTLWDWHQDYPFWMKEDVARPDMCSIAIALGPITEANGAIQLVRGSHHLGVIPVVPVGPSQSSDPEVVGEALKTHHLELCELELGDAVVFHSNTLHSSGPNESDVPRTMLMSSYTAVSNQPAAPIPARDCSRIEPLDPSALAAAAGNVFGPNTFCDPIADGQDQGYKIGIL